ncbi:Gfo/Idh/MocA family protein [Bauldia sp.]|uniref:Gfo/Idh/MocA family protein n=1 Tax=Bauldia sp. TaxID=2575872 RepID=UPI003BAC3930
MSSPRHLGTAAPRIGLLGCGAIGSWHGRILAEHTGVDFAGICDLRSEIADAFAARFDVPAFDDPERFFAETGLDGVIIASPESAHVDNIALAAGNHVACLVEKPVAATIGEIEAIEDILRRTPVPLMSGHIERFETGTAQLKSALDEGVCGRLVSILARRQFASGELPRFAGYSSTLRILAVHDFDLLRWLHGGSIADVYAAAGRGELHEQYGLDDHVVTVIRFADGAIGSVESAWNLPLAYADFSSPKGWGPAGNNRLDVFGDRGFLSNDMSIRNQQLVAFDQASGFRAAGIRHQPVVHGKVEGALRVEVEHFVRCITEGLEPIVGIADAKRAVALVQAAEESLAAGRPVTPYC